MSARAVPFEGDPPQVQSGDPIEIRDADSMWHPSIAKGEPRYDYANAVGRRCWLTVPVLLPDQSIVNWPAEAVRSAKEER